MTPTLVIRDGKPVLVTGSPGGARIISTVQQQVVELHRFWNEPSGSGRHAALSPPVDARRTAREKGFSADTLALLQQWGHKVAVKPAMGRTQSIEIRDGKLLGASDPRNPDGKAMGFDDQPLSR